MPSLKTYSDPEIQAKLVELNLPGWTLENGWLRRKFTTDGWRTTMMLANSIAFFCEAADHHADLAITWGKIWVKLQTHSAGGITDKDFELAQKIEQEALWKPTGGALTGTTTKWVKGDT